MMKKIVLIDDICRNQRKDLGASFVDDGQYADCLIHKEKLGADSDYSFLEDAACIMIHRSIDDYEDGKFHEASRKAFGYVKGFLDVNRNVPCVYFSDGDKTDAEWNEMAPNVIYSLKKSEFYRNLGPFLDAYRATGEVDLRIIAYGKDYMKRYMSRWYQAVMKDLAPERERELVAPSMIDRRSLRLFIENAGPAVGVSMNDVMKMMREERLTVKDLRGNLGMVLRDVMRYGENTSSWK